MLNSEQSGWRQSEGIEVVGPLFSSRPAALPLDRLTMLAARLSRTFALARVLVEGGRRLDLTGVEDGVGILCAQILDLEPEESRSLLPLLGDVLKEIELLSAALRSVPAQDTRPC